MHLSGVDRLYDLRSLTFAEEPFADTDGHGVDMILHSLAGEAINQNLRVLRLFSCFLELGKRDFYENTHIGLRPFRNNLSYFGIDSNQLVKVCLNLTQTLFSKMMALFEDNSFTPLPYTPPAAIARWSSGPAPASRHRRHGAPVVPELSAYPTPCSSVASTSSRSCILPCPSRACDCASSSPANIPKSGRLDSRQP